MLMRGPQFIPPEIACWVMPQLLPFEGNQKMVYDRQTFPLENTNKKDTLPKNIEPRMWKDFVSTEFNEIPQQKNMIA